MLNYIWLGLVVLAVVIGGYNGALDEVTKSGFDMAKVAVMEIALPLSAIWVVWLGVMRLAEKSGLVLILARAVRPIMRWLFPEVPPEHPAMGSMLLNIAANMLGLSNAATPVGLRAMSHLEKLNPKPGTATNAMCMFLTINTSSVQLIPATAVGILSAAGSSNPTAIVGTAFLATLCSTGVGIFVAKLFEKFRGARRIEPIEPLPVASPEESKEPEPALEAFVEPPKPTTRGKIILALFLALFGYFFVTLVFPDLQLQKQFPKIFPQMTVAGTTAPDISHPQNTFMKIVNAISILAIPFFLSFFPLYASLRRVKVYEEFVEGAKEGFQVAVRIIPFLVAILTAIGMFRGAGGIDLLTQLLKPVLNFLRFPSELLPLVLMRPLSGSGSIALVGDLVKTHGPDSIFSLMGATILGSTETTFYVIAVYFGSVAIRRTRHAVASGLIADLAGIIASIIICRMMFG
jgi:spore maturation protein SpmA